MSEREKFEKWFVSYHGDHMDLRRMGEFPNYADNFTYMFAVAWQAALSTRKPYGYGIVDKDGNRKTKMVFHSSERAGWYAKNMSGFSNPVRLFYEDSES